MHCGSMIGPHPPEPADCAALCDRLRGHCGGLVQGDCEAMCRERAHNMDARQCVEDRLNSGDQACPPEIFESCKAPGCHDICDRVDFVACSEINREGCAAECERLAPDPMRRRCAGDRLTQDPNACPPALFENCGGGPGPDCPMGSQDMEPDFPGCETLLLGRPDVPGWGFVASTRGDWDGDGMPDLLVGPRYQSLIDGMGQVTVFRGADGVQAASWNGSPGAPLVAGGWLGDVDGHQGDEILVGEPHWSDAPAAPRRGRVLAYSTRGGPAVVEVHGSDDEYLGRYAVAGPDLNGDGLPSIWAIGRAAMDAWNSVSIFRSADNWADRVPLRLVLAGGDISERCFDLGADVTGDDTPDLIASTSNALYVVSGDPGAQGPPPLIATVPVPGGWGEEAQACSFVPDVSGDGVADILVAGIGRPTGKCVNRDTVILSGAAPDELVRCIGAPDDLSTSVALGPDFDQDNKPELLIGFGERVEAWSLVVNDHPLRVWHSFDHRRLDVSSRGLGDVDGDGVLDPVLQAHEDNWGSDEVLLVRTGGQP